MGAIERERGFMEGLSNAGIDTLIRRNGDFLIQSSLFAMKMHHPRARTECFDRKHRLHLFGYIVNRWVTLLLYDGIGVNFFGGGIWEGLRVIAAKGLWSVAKEAFSSLAEGGGALFRAPFVAQVEPIGIGFGEIF